MSGTDEFRQRVLGFVIDNNDIVFDHGWVFWPSENRGSYNAASLRVIADELDNRNNVEELACQ